MEADWLVPSWDQDTGVRMEQNLSWPMPGADWLTVSLHCTSTSTFSVNLLILFFILLMFYDTYVTQTNMVDNRVGT